LGEFAPIERSEDWFPLERYLLTLFTSMEGGKMASASSPVAAAAFFSSSYKHIMRSQYFLLQKFS
jgi:hypothetical protein